MAALDRRAAKRKEAANDEQIVVSNMSLMTGRSLKRTHAHILLRERRVPNLVPKGIGNEKCGVRGARNDSLGRMW
jgi:hypothetical protein